MSESAVASSPAEEVRLLDVNAVSRLLSCSTRHVYRLADSGLMPRPQKLGALVRWDRLELDKWLADGCPTCR
ncbi:MAG: helix-turn-helix domain-containing protein [Pirellulales bacterium]|nr:helix-turn-helix domain-containing protein [Pirellulales bacterium]